MAVPEKPRLPTAPEQADALGENGATVPVVPPAVPRVDAETAQDIADEFLIRKVGDLVGAGTPRLAPDGRWTVPVLLGNVAQGMLGEVGTVTVDSATGEVVFSEEDRAKVMAR